MCCSTLHIPLPLYGPRVTGSVLARCLLQQLLQLPVSGPPSELLLPGAAPEWDRHQVPTNSCVMVRPSQPAAGYVCATCTPDFVQVICCPLAIPSAKHPRLRMPASPDLCSKPHIGAWHLQEWQSSCCGTKAAKHGCVQSWP